MAKKRSRNGEAAEVRRDGALSVTFVNTASGRRRALATWADLLAWAVRCGAVGAGEAPRLERAAARRSVGADFVRRAAELRALLERIVVACADRVRPAAADLEALNGELGAALAARRLVAAGDGYRWTWDADRGPGLERLLWPVVLSAAELLESGAHRRVRRCAGEGCGLFFVDRSPGAGRKWCSMRSCGGRVKSRRHYRRKQHWIRTRGENWEEEFLRAVRSEPSPSADGREGEEEPSP